MMYLFPVLMAGCLLAMALANQDPPGTSYAHCELVPGLSYADFRVKPNAQFMEIFLNVSTGLIDPVLGEPAIRKLHGLHVHEFSDVSNNCVNTGGHLNPLKAVHGDIYNSPDKRHVGDFGNFRENGNGRIIANQYDYLASLSGPTSILGRTLVLTEHYDDLGRGGDPESFVSGNAGSRLQCCLITAFDDSRWA